jgi:hypothetical protein
LRHIRGLDSASSRRLLAAAAGATIGLGAPVSATFAASLKLQFFTLHSSCAGTYAGETRQNHNDYLGDPVLNYPGAGRQFRVKMVVSTDGPLFGGAPAKGRLCGYLYPTSETRFPSWVCKKPEADASRPITFTRGSRCTRATWYGMVCLARSEGPGEIMCPQ